MKTIVSSALVIGALLTTGAVYAQTTATVVRDSATIEKIDFKKTWRSSKLIGLDVYNQADEKLGDINELLLDAEGRVKAVVIGVGGFLGMGEHDIAVSMDKLKFMETPHAKAASADRKTTTGTTTTGTTATAPRDRGASDWAPDHAVMSGTKEQLKALPQFKYTD
jgi:sporulation protein YlmC with PRC-barrel domain